MQGGTDINTQRVADAICYILADAYSIAERIHLPKRITDAISVAYRRAVKHSNDLFWAERARDSAANRHGTDDID
jgi:hypothetical protein